MKCEYCIETFKQEATYFYALKSHVTRTVIFRQLALCHIHNYDNLIDYDKISEQEYLTAKVLEL